MSGIEIAGLILAVIPLFIAAAEKLQDHRKTKKAIITDSLVRQYKSDLNQQRIILTSYLKDIVSRTTLAANTQAELVEEPDGAAWEDEEVVRVISKQLGDAYQPFVDLLDRITKMLALCVESSMRTNEPDRDVVAMLKKLSLNKNQTSSSPGKEPTIKLKFKPAEWRTCLQQVKDCNNDLNKLSKAAMRAKPYEETQQVRQAHAAFREREEAERLFYVLGKACKCTNADAARHVALRLERPGQKADADLHSRFQVLLFDSQSVLCEVSARIARAVAAEPPAKKKRVGFTSPQASNTQNLQANAGKVLEEICDEARLAAKNNSPFEIYVDDKEAVFAHHQCTSGTHKASSRELLSLTAAMSRFAIGECQGKKWLHRQKSILAIILAYSLLRLHDSPWMQSVLDPDSISFLDEDGGQINEQLRLNRPFTRSQVSTSSNTGAKPTISRAPRNAHVHALGVILLELYLNRSIQPDPQQRALNTESGDLRFLAFKELGRCEDDMLLTHEYKTAVNFCLNPISGTGTDACFTLDDPDCRETFYREVIVKLEANLRVRFLVKDDDFV